MSISHTRLDRFIGEHLQISRRDVRLMLAQRRISVDGQAVNEIGFIINKFSHVQLDGETLQNHQAYYVMLHKPVGVVSATVDAQHRTVIDLLSHPAKNELHIVGRLDLNTSGLVLLTNDSRWSERLMSPEHKVAKKYLVTVEHPISKEQERDYIDAFAKGMYFQYEDITTMPASLMMIDPHLLEVQLFEGKYHQIKRMFGRFQNPVIGLHRKSVGALELDAELAVGESRMLTSEEVSSIFN
ncbi:16S rRNA pseudouridine(516) synthase [Colwellia sp. 1_MG-2023]|uniref:pseudouridine synthase n=1 Tax=Colwellia sp. 1_MG-2023 TaxID=3062649 RepID=UPI0026E46A86|nr:16S rRNA pseudouridine(516) synthase [Colwellia sp. 1_MG-2023]MDO6447190.1 16S rRNA pseudouridine(516) synthase [Colwellia sp. 1_MG-2023]